MTRRPNLAGQINVPRASALGFKRLRYVPRSTGLKRGLHDRVSPLTRPVVADLAGHLAGREARQREVLRRTSLANDHVPPLRVLLDRNGLYPDHLPSMVKV